MNATDLDSPPSGARAVLDEAELPDWQQKQLEQLEALGYVQGSQTASGIAGVTTFDRKKTQPGLNLYTSGHAPAAILADLEGTPYEWRFPFEKAWAKFPGRTDPVHSKFWRRIHLFENGELLAIFEGDDRMLVASLFEVERIPRSFVRWLKVRAGSGVRAQRRPTL